MGCSAAGASGLLGPGPGFNRAYAMTTDPTQQVIIATLPPPAMLRLSFAGRGSLSGSLTGPIPASEF